MAKTTRRRGRVLILGFALVSVPAFASPESRLRDVEGVFNPVLFQPGLEAFCASLLLVCQLLSVLWVVGGFIVRFQSGATQLENLASMMLRVAFIATVPLWRSLAVETNTSLVAALGGQAFEVAQGGPAGSGTRSETSALLKGIQSLETQWCLESSPLAEALAELGAPMSNREEVWLRQGWNWARAASVGASTEEERAWAVAAGVERASLQTRLLLAVGFGVQFTQAAFFIAEGVRQLLFQAGFALAPLLIGGLGSSGLQNPALRSLLGLLSICLWQPFWALVNQCTLPWLSHWVDLLGKNAAAALNPHLPEGLAPTIALASPYLSWAQLSHLGLLTLLLCLWMLGGLIGTPLLLYGALSSGARLGKAGRE